MVKRLFRKKRQHTRSQLEAYVVEMLTPAFARLGLEPVGGNTFARITTDVVQIARIVFLEKRRARYLGAKAVSFSIELGVCYRSARDCDGTPVDWTVLESCHIRSLLRRGLGPRPAATDLTSAERRRREIWWVRPTDASLQRVLGRVARSLEIRGRAWLARFSNLSFAVWYLERWSTRPDVPGGALVSLELRDAQERQRLIRSLRQRLEELEDASL